MQCAIYMIVTIFRQRIVGRATLVEKIAAQVIFVPMRKKLADTNSLTDFDWSILEKVKKDNKRVGPQSSR